MIQNEQLTGFPDNSFDIALKQQQRDRKRKHDAPDARIYRRFNGNQMNVAQDHGTENCDDGTADKGSDFCFLFTPYRKRAYHNNDHPG